MKISRFEDIESWKEARKLVVDVYAIFVNCKDFGFKDQVQRAAISVMSNIAEGFDRASNKEFIQFLVIARGAVSEVRVFRILVATPWVQQTAVLMDF